MWDMKTIYFPKGTKGFIARVASETEGGYIELRLDSPSGELVGRVHVEKHRRLAGLHRSVL